MKVYVLPADKYGCGHYRLIWPADVLRRQGHDVVIIPPDSRTGFLAKTQEDSAGREIIVSVQAPEDADVIVTQRPAHMFQPQMIDILRANKIAVVVDMDDDMSCIHPHNGAFHMYRNNPNSPLSWKNAAESCKKATLVTTSTASLQKVYAKHGRGITIDNYVPGAYLGFDKPPTGAFGWAGTMQSHPNDPQVSTPAVQKLAAEGFPFHVIGDGKGVAAAMRLPKAPPCTGFVGLTDWAKAICGTIDVGMVPLAATSFNTSKSRLKGIEMSAVGVPWVASPREEYRRLAKQSGAGLLADTPREWYEKLKLLMTDEVMRKELAEAGKDFMADQTYESQAWRWAEAWEQAYRMERG